ncbi:type II toxin-antitoxin system VapC family toxin [Tepidiforma sp.]|uniref:type II toxin-antitoxin system VapC family toxin n=1 Tax=Tepidiforma sp. TaxID=2682230 RepID=UPI002ADDF2BF|nr:type II toxin-antitoxin system VapC family toxin [Tepidiforma sp.]
MPFVMDASVAMGFLLGDDDTGYADRVARALSTDIAVVPSLFRLECANVLLGAERRARISPGQANEALDLLLGLPVYEATYETGLAQRHLLHVLDLGRQHGLSAYDAAYLSLALDLRLPLATTDGRLRAAAASAGVPLLFDTGSALA